jgi:hypothetical protein
MSEFLKDSGHRAMQTCDHCHGAFYCAVPENWDAAEDWTCPRCTESTTEIARLREQLGGANAMVETLRSMEGKAMANNARLRAALKPFAEFAKAFDAKPMMGTADEVYSIHCGTQWEAYLRLLGLPCRPEGAGGDMIERKPDDVAEKVATVVARVVQALGTDDERWHCRVLLEEFCRAREAERVGLEALKVRDATCKALADALAAQLGHMGRHTWGCKACYDIDAALRLVGRL